MLTTPQKINSTDGLGFHVYGFMRRLGLKRNELYVYSLVYSFTQGKRGSYYGTVETIANMLGISKRSVERAIMSLKARGLVARKEEKGKRGLYAIVPKFKKPSVKDATASELEEYDGRYQTSDGQIIELDAKTAQLMEENEARFAANNTTKYLPLKYGKEGLVLLTKEQYERLRCLLPREQLDGYLHRYELMLKSNADDPAAKPPHSPYRILKKWINNDFAT